MDKSVKNIVVGLSLILIASYGYEFYLKNRSKKKLEKEINRQKETEELSERETVYHTLYEVPREKVRKYTDLGTINLNKKAI